MNDKPMSDEPTNSMSDKSTKQNRLISRTNARDREILMRLVWTQQFQRTAPVMLAFLLGMQSFMPAQAADWGYDNESVNDQESDRNSNRAPADTVEELDAAPAGFLNPPRGQKPAKPAAKSTKPGAKPVAKSKPGASSKSTGSPKPAVSNPDELNADPSTFGSSDDSGSGADPGSSGQDQDSGNDANFERDPVYREGISLPPTKVPTDQQGKIINAWLNVFGLCSPIADRHKLPKGPDFTTQLTDEQKARFTVTLKKLLNGKEQAGYKQIENYWGALARLLHDVDHISNYRVLFRALLSMRADAPDISDDERGMINEALGPKRIAEIGPPPLTEDAIEAYTDMTCFLYEQSHAGKTVDADDNRALYAMIIRDKFKKAPTDRDRMAMNQFPLSWAKFRILYTDANPSEKVLLAERIASEQGTRGLGIRNAMLEQVLSSPVWMRFVVGSNKVMTTSNANSNSNAGFAKPKPRPDNSAFFRSHGLDTDAVDNRLDSLERGLELEERRLRKEGDGPCPEKKSSPKPASTPIRKRNW